MQVISPLMPWRQDPLLVWTSSGMGMHINSTPLGLDELRHLCGRHEIPNWFIPSTYFILTKYIRLFKSHYFRFAWVHRRGKIEIKHTDMNKTLRKRLLMRKLWWWFPVSEKYVNNRIILRISLIYLASYRRANIFIRYQYIQIWA